MRPLLRDNHHFTLHTQIIMKSTNVIVSTRMCESNADARHPWRRLSKPNPILRCSGKESRAHTVTCRIYYPVPGPVRIRVYVDESHGVRRLCTEGNSMRLCRVQ